MNNIGQIEKNQAVTIPVVLRSTADGSMLSNPTIAAGDFKVSIGGAALANLTNLPTVNPAASGSVELVLTAAEMNSDRVIIIWKDQTAPAEWEDDTLVISPSEPITDLALLRKTLLNKRDINANTNTEIIYDDDGVTPLKTITHSEDTAGIITQSVA